MTMYAVANVLIGLMRAACEVDRKPLVTVCNVGGWDRLGISPASTGTTLTIASGFLMSTWLVRPGDREAS